MSQRHAKLVTTDTPSTPFAILKNLASGSAALLVDADLNGILSQRGVGDNQRRQKAATSADVGYPTADTTRTGRARNEPTPSPGGARTSRLQLWPRKSLPGSINVVACFLGPSGSRRSNPSEWEHVHGDDHPGRRPGTISGSLSWAIEQVNSDTTPHPGPPADTYQIQHPGLGPDYSPVTRSFTINPTSPLPPHTRPVVHRRHKPAALPRNPDHRDQRRRHGWATGCSWPPAPTRARSRAWTSSTSRTSSALTARAFISSRTATSSSRTTPVPTSRASSRPRQLLRGVHRRRVEQHHRGCDRGAFNLISGISFDRGGRCGIGIVI